MRYIITAIGFLAVTRSYTLVAIVALVVGAASGYFFERHMPVVGNDGWTCYRP